MTAPLVSLSPDVFLLGMHPEFSVVWDDVVPTNVEALQLLSAARSISFLVICDATPFRCDCRSYVQRKYIFLIPLLYGLG